MQYNMGIYLPNIPDVPFLDPWPATENNRTKKNAPLMSLECGDWLSVEISRLAKSAMWSEPS
jgi:hypothetical protein